MAFVRQRRRECRPKIVVGNMLFLPHQPQHQIAPRQRALRREAGSID
jgi:hypothetical protein